MDRSRVVRLVAMLCAACIAMVAVLQHRSEARLAVHTDRLYQLQDEPRHLLLVYASTFYGSFKTGPDRVLRCPSHWSYDESSDSVSDLLVTLSTNLSRAPDAHGLVYYGPDIAAHPPLNSIDPSSSRAGQLFPVNVLDDTRLPRKRSTVNIYFSEDPPFSSGYAVDPTIYSELNSTAMRNFQVFTGFHPLQQLGHDGQVCYSGWGMRAFSSHTFGARGRYWSSEIIPFAERRTDFHSCWVQSNCADGSNVELSGQSRRKELVQVLMKSGRVASLGSCLHNVNFPKDVVDDRSFGTSRKQCHEQRLRCLIGRDVWQVESKTFPSDSSSSCSRSKTIVRTSNGHFALALTLGLGFVL